MLARPFLNFPFCLLIIIGALFLASCGLALEEPVPLPLGFEENGFANLGEDTLKADGQPCADDSECGGGTCLTGHDWPQGYCTTLGCRENTDCAGEPGAVTCYEHAEEGAMCGALCSAIEANSCRPGYGCNSIGGATGWCMQRDSMLGGHIGIDEDFPFPTYCTNPTNRNAALEFEIAPSTTSYMLVPIASNMGQITPQFIQLPSGARVDFQTANNFQVSGFSYFGINPIIVPAAPQFSSQLESGDHTLHLTTNDSEVCFYLLESKGSPTKLDLNFYFVGLNHLNLTASTAATHTNFQSLLTETNKIYAQAGFAMGKTRYFDVEPSVAERFAIIRDDNALSELLTHSAYPGATEDDALSINVFVTRQITHGPLGVSMGAPGIAGLHGTLLSGVVISGEYMNNADFGVRYTSVVLAHETGHFLGLEHTSEIGGQIFDILLDTPECTDFNANNPWRCPDWGNLMFPIAGPNNTALSAAQRHVLQVSPLTK